MKLKMVEKGTEEKEALPELLKKERRMTGCDGARKLA